MKVAIVGDSVSTRHLAPFADPSWEIWGLGNGYLHLKRATRYFELHRPADVLSTIRIDTWAGAPLRLGVQEMLTHPEIPDLITKNDEGRPIVGPFPFEKVEAEFGPYFTSSFAWIIGFALTAFGDQLTHLGLWGADMSLLEYATQKACVEHMLGIAIGRGVRVHVPAASLMLRAPFRYALDTEAHRRARSLIGDQREHLQRNIEKLNADLALAKDARICTQARIDEHQTFCECVKGTHCARRKILQADLERAIADEIESGRSTVQMRARLDENNYYQRACLFPDPEGDVDREYEAKQVPKFAERGVAEYSGEVVRTETVDLVMGAQHNGQMDVFIPPVPAAGSNGHQALTPEEREKALAAY